MELLRTSQFALVEFKDDDETVASGVIRAQWSENGQPRSASFPYESIPEYHAAVLDAMAFIVANRKCLD